MVRRPIKFTSVDNVFYRDFNAIDVSNYKYINDVNTFAKNISSAIYMCVRERSADLVRLTVPATVMPTLLEGTG